MARARARGASGKRVFMSASLGASARRPRPSPQRRGRPGRWPAPAGSRPRWPSAAASRRAPRRGARAQGGGADLRVLVAQQPVGDRHEVGAPRRAHQVQRAQHDVAGRVVEDEGGDEPDAPFLGQQVERRHHLDVVTAVERGEERLQGLQVQLGSVGVAAHGALAQRVPEQLQVVRAQVDGPGDPDHAQHGHRQREHDVAAAQHDLAQDEERTRSPGRRAGRSRR